MSDPRALLHRSGVEPSWRAVDAAIHGFCAEDKDGNRIDPANVLPCPCPKTCALAGCCEGRC